MRDGRGFLLMRGLPVERYSDDDVGADLLGHGPLHGRAPPPEPAGRSAGPRLRPRTHATATSTCAATRPTPTCRITPTPATWSGLLCLRRGLEGGLEQHRQLGHRPQRDPGPSSRVSRAPLQRLLLHPPRGGPDRARRVRAPHPDLRLPGRRGELPLHPQPDQCRRGEARRAAHPDRAGRARLSRRADAPSPDLRLDMDLRAGDIQFINNYTTLHSRTGLRGRRAAASEAPHAAAVAEVPAAVAARSRVPVAHGLQAAQDTPILVEAEG